tara:strand:- start:487 stop:846 length:360 start_codon:yes stop_codon:yes gene_type:complete
MVDTTNIDEGDQNEFKDKAEQWGHSLLGELASDQIEAGHTIAKNTNVFSFATVYEYIKEGKKVSRRGWNNRHIWIILYNHGNNHYRGFKDFIVMMTTEGKYVPWTPSQTDLLTEDWILI